MRVAWAACLLTVACTGTEDTGLDTATTVTATVDVSASLEVIGKRRSDSHDQPQDLAFNPDVDGDMWVVNKADDSVSIYHEVGTSAQTSEHIIDPFALHFMERVTSIAWGANGNFGTCQDGRNTYNDSSEGNDFTGPTLWTSDRSIFGITNPEAVEELSDLFGFPVDLGSHIDMLHESPNCMGIEWDEDNVYWVFDGLNGNIVRYDFAQDHGPGFDDHSDGVISRHTGAKVKRVANTVSHMVMDQSTKLLYIADTGRNRITVLDTRSGERGRSLQSSDCWQGQCADYHEWDNSDYSVLIDGDAEGLVMPAGIDLVSDTLVITDAGTGEIVLFDLEGNLIQRLQTGITEEKALAGIVARSLNDFWFIDSKGDQVLRLQR